MVSLSVDGKELTDRGVIEIRKAPGHCHFDFGQRIPLLKPSERKISSLNDNLYSALSLLSPRREFNSAFGLRYTQYPWIIAFFFFSATVGVEVSSYEHPTAPRGFVYQIVVLSTWGDQYYVGLNGIQMYDIQGRLILLNGNSKYWALWLVF